MDRLSVLTRACLHRAGIDTLEELKSKSYEDFLMVRNLGKRGMDEIEKLLSEVEERKE